MNLFDCPPKLRPLVFGNLPHIRILALDKRVHNQSELIQICAVADRSRLKRRNEPLIPWSLRNFGNSPVVSLNSPRPQFDKIRRSIVTCHVIDRRIQTRAQRQKRNCVIRSPYPPANTQ